MRLPYLKHTPGKSRQQIINFGGINYGEGASPGELEESRGLSSARYPSMSQREGRKTYAEYAAPTGLYARGALCVVDGTDLIYDGEVVGTVTPGEKQFATINTKVVIYPDKLFYDTETGELKPLEASVSRSGVTFTTETMTISGAALDTQFSAGDAVEISGCTTLPDNNKSAIIRSLTATTLTFDGDIFVEGTESGTVKISREVPDLDCICESDNRIWGAAGSTIYASALGDPRNFNVFDGLSTDSYAAAVGTDGEFTGCIAYSSGVLFWKEDCVHKVLGSYPAQYEIYTYSVPGLQKGSEKSMAIINEALYYKGRAGVYVYSGGVPSLISENFGTRRFYSAVGGTDGERYYVSMSDEDDMWGLYVYDTLRGIWLREDGTHATDFTNLDGTLYYLDGVTKKVMMTGQDDSEEGRVDWMASFAPFTEQVNDRKCYSKLSLRLEVEPGAWMNVHISCDKQPWKKVWSTHDSKAPTMTAVIRPERCDAFRVKLTGKGRVTIRSFLREFETGGYV